MKRIAYTRPDGGVSVEVPTAEFIAKFATEAEGLAAVRALVVPADAANVVELDETALPDREFRTAWRLNAGTVIVDLAAARDLQAERIDAAKRVRARDLLEREVLGENIAAEKAQINAINARAQVGAAQDIAALKAAFPAGLSR